MRFDRMQSGVRAILVLVLVVYAWSPVTSHGQYEDAHAALGRQADQEIASLSDVVDQQASEIEQLNDRIKQLEEDCKPDPGPDPEPPTTELPEELDRIEVSTVAELKAALRRSDPGTHVVLLRSLVTDRPISVNGIAGTAQHPVVLRGAQPGVSISLKGWAAGIHGALLQLRGTDFWVANLAFDGGNEQRGGAVAQHRLE